MTARRRILILGAAGRDFHTFNVCHRDRADTEVVAFTATQIPDIAGRRYPPELAGPYHPDGIPIRPESELPDLLAGGIDECIFAYSDVPHAAVMHLASLANAHGAAFTLPAAATTMLPASKPVVSVCAVRTGAGKSPAARAIAAELRAAGLRVGVLRHPMPYGDLARQAVQCFETREDLAEAHCTIEEREEYEPHIAHGDAVFAGVDYARIIARAEQVADVLLWDGGNNDTPFVRPDLEIVLADPHRAGDEMRYYPGEVNLRRADVICIAKIDTAKPEDVALVRENIRRANPGAIVVEAALPVQADAPERMAGKRVLVVEDGPTLTHGDMSWGAGVLAARRAGAAELADPRPHAVGSIRTTLETYPRLERCLPAMGYGEAQMAELAATIDATPCDVVCVATPVDLRPLIGITKPTVRVTYECELRGGADWASLLAPVIDRARR